MADRAIVLALANPEPEIDLRAAADHAEIVATGRSDHPNQINNVLAFPGVFRGLLDSGATTVTTAIRLTAADALAAVAGTQPSGSCPVCSTKNWCPPWRPRWPTLFDERRRGYVTDGSIYPDLA
jgi:malic enzyme